jgi:hypothetical protein
VFLGEASWQKFSLVYSKLHVPADFDLSSHAVELAHEEEEEEEGGGGGRRGRRRRRRRGRGRGARVWGEREIFWRVAKGL